MLVLAALTGCGGYDMEDQAKYEPYETAALFEDGSAQQHPVPGTVARGELATLAVLEERPPLTLDLLERGRERYGIYCWPCHGATGDGNGIITRRGFPNPPSYHIPRLVQAPDRHFMDVIRDGYGVMYSYAARVPPADRWAIVAWIRALQLSQHAEVAALDEADRAALQDLAR
ncbi:MAG TPA: cytochrome c [Geminicoccaceae bacterium]